MLAELDRTFGEMEAKRAELTARLAAMDDAARRTPVAKGFLSPLGIAEHLLVMEEMHAGYVAKADEAARAGRPPKRPRFGSPFVPLIVFLMTRSVPVPTPPEMLPKGASAEEIGRRWDAARASLRERLERVTAADAQEPIALHPAAGPLGAATLLRLLDVHLDYHLRQVPAAAAPAAASARAKAA